MNRKKQTASVILALMLAAAPLAMLSGCQGGSRPAGEGGTPAASQSSEAAASAPSSDGQGGSSEASAPASDGQGGTPAAAVDYGLKSDLREGVILHAWCWSFNTIRESLADIAAAGYSAIQTSPANAVVEGGEGGLQLMGKGKWYYQYQPTDWVIGNYQLGTEEDFKALCAEAEKYGIKIIVDVVPNHTAADKSAVSQNLIDAAGGADKLYHKNAGEGISNYGDRLQCTTYSLTGLPDVNTENPAFQDYFVKYLNQLIADGADGFRYDTAKHIGLPDDPKDDPSLENNFWEVVTTRIDKADTIFNYGEVLQGDNERIEDYIKAIGCTTASAYGGKVRSFVQTGRFKADAMVDLSVGGSNSAVTWVESHDNYTGDGTYKLSEGRLLQGWAIITANGNGTPLFFDRPYGASESKQWGTMNRIGAAGSDLYKDPTVVALNRFRNAMTGEPTTMTNPDSEAGMTFMMVNRGKKGAVLLNGKTEEFAVDAATDLPDGTYTDRSGKNGDFTVSGGRITGNLISQGIAVLYNDGYTEPVAMPKVGVDTEDFVTTESSMDVILHVTGASGGTYSISGGEAAAFSDGDKITLSITDTVPLKLSATNDAGLTTNMTFYYTKAQSTASGETISFEKPAEWGSEVYAYIYDETVSPAVTNADWPGEKMESSGGSSYTYTLTRDWSNALVIFSDGNGNQYPAAMEPGDSLEAGKTYTASSSSGGDAPQPAAAGAAVTFTKPDSWGDDINAYVYENGGGGNNGQWPGKAMTKQSDGSYTYEVPSDIKNPLIIFNDGKNQFPKTDGLEVEDGKTYTVG